MPALNADRGPEITLAFFSRGTPLERLRWRARSLPWLTFRLGMERNRAKIVPLPGCCNLTGPRPMSRAFVKDAEYLEELPERPVSEYPNDVTEAGLAQIEHAVQAASEAYAQAQASADRAALAAARRDLRYLTARRATARVVPAPAGRPEVRFGTAVPIVRDGGREQTFRIVGEDEADPAPRSISHCSPLARAQFRKRGC